MPFQCSVSNCRASKLKNRDVRLFHVPVSSENDLQWKKDLNLRKKRCALWLQRLGKSHYPEEKIRLLRVCSEHFVSYKPSALEDVNNPDWAPSLYLVEGETKEDANRERRRLQRQQAKTSAQNNFLLELRTESHEKCFLEPRIDNKLSSQATSGVTGELGHAQTIDESMETTHSRSIQFLEAKKPFEGTADIDTQTDSSFLSGKCNLLLQKKNEELTELRAQLDKHRVQFERLLPSVEDLRKTVQREKKKTIEPNTIETFRGNHEKTEYFTGLDRFETFELLYESLVEQLPCSFLKNISPFQMLLLTLAKLRRDIPFSYYGTQFDVSQTSIYRKFHDCMALLATQLAGMIKWPERSIAIKEIPSVFKDVFGKKLIVILKSVEYALDPAEKRNTKNRDSFKFLIAITHSGLNCFVSESFDGRCDDKEILENSKIMEHLQPEDVILCDEKFLSNDVVTSCGSRRILPAFYLKDSQFHPIEMKPTKEVIVLKNRVEQILRENLKKYDIIHNYQPIARICKRTGDDRSYYARITRVCCALDNLNRCKVMQSSIEKNSKKANAVPFLKPQIEGMNLPSERPRSVTKPIKANDDHQPVSMNASQLLPNTKSTEISLKGKGDPFSQLKITSNEAKTRNELPSTPKTVTSPVKTCFLKLA